MQPTLISSKQKQQFPPFDLERLLNTIFKPKAGEVPTIADAVDVLKLNIVIQSSSDKAEVEAAWRKWEAYPASNNPSGKKVQAPKVNQ
jgi:hypothetical protein